MREYRREVCALCYKYDRGRNLPVKGTTSGKAFCTDDCKGAWEADVGPNKQCWELLESYVKRKGGREIEMADVGAPRPTFEGIEHEWAQIEELGGIVRDARATAGDAITKRHRKAINEALDAKDRIADPDVLGVLLSGILLRACKGTRGNPEKAATPATNEEASDMLAFGSTSHGTSAGWPRLLNLASTSTPYPNAQTLRAHTHAYMILLALLPTHLITYITPETCRLVPSHETHNSFGLRSLDDSGDEFLGYGVWPEASFFNHSCEPNVGKARGKGDAKGDANGRTWTFWTTRDVAGGEELAISYLGGEEATLDVAERKQRLLSTWGFDCCCAKCDREAG